MSRAVDFVCAGVLVAGLMLGAFVTLVVTGPTSPPAVEAKFSPSGGCEDLVKARLAAAKVSARVAMYEFTSAPLAAALVDAKKRGVDVAVVLDAEAAKGKGCQLKALLAGGVPVWLDSQHHIMHDKYAVIDGATVLTGSYNWTHHAEHDNAENLVALPGADVAKAFSADWQRHASHSKRAE